MRKLIIPLLASFLLVSTACTTFVGATSDGPIEDDPGKRSLGARIDDDIIEIKARVNIRSSDERFTQSRVIVNSYNGIILLVGQVPTENLRRKAGEIAAGVNRVRTVHNELQVIDNISFMARSNDRWINTRVRSRLALTDEIDASRIRVITENGVVYMLGIVTPEQADIAADIVRKTNGVQKVVRVFEYI